MVTLAIVLYVILAIFLGPIWPLEMLGNKAGLIGRIIVLGWLSLFFIGK